MDGFQKRTLKKKEAILKAALTLFNQYGYKNVTIAKIAKEAHVSLETIYNYFESKDNLKKELLKQIIDDFCFLTESIMKSDLPIAAKFEKLLRSKVDFAEQFSPQFLTEELRELNDLDLFGGRIEVDSTPGEGSVFTVTIPFAVAKERNRPQPLPVNVEGARVLVIDDNDINRRILSEQLALWGFDGVAVESGHAAMAVLEEAHRLGLTIDALIIDYQMPVMNGLDVARMIRADHRFESIAMIFLTSMDMVGDERIFQQLNVQAHLMKPARANLLRGAIVDVVRAARLGRPLALVDQSKRPVLPAEKPRAPVIATARAETPARSAGVGATMPARAGCDVLVAEDNEVNQIVFRQILQSTDLSHRIVGNGREAIVAWRAHNPRLILMDVSMPILNGHQAARTIREAEKAEGEGRHVPIIGVTAHALDSDREACLAAGMDDYLSKPISPEQLEAKIERWLGQSLRDGSVVLGAGI